MKSASSSFSISLVTALLHSGANTLHFFCTGLYYGLMLRQCCIIFLSIPGVSLCFQAKTSWFALKKEIIFSFLRAGSAVLIFNNFDESPGTISTSFGVSNGSEMGSSSLITHVWFSPDAKAALWHYLAKTWSSLISPTPWAIGNFTFK